MINVHDRVDMIAKHLDPNWVVVDFGCGDKYLKTIHPNTINVDRINNPGVDRCSDLDWEYPDIKADCAVISGLLEWLIYPVRFLAWALENYERVYFSYANQPGGDILWLYQSTMEEILDLIKPYPHTLESWDGQTIFYIERKPNERLDNSNSCNCSPACCGG